MIPYDDLVIALATWRARQGLPVSQLSAALTPPPPVTAPAAVPIAFAPAPSSQIARTAPPMAPPARAPAQIVPAAADFGSTHDESLDVDDAALLEEAHYDDEGDFALAFGGAAAEGGESTAIGVPPPPRPIDDGLDLDDAPPPPPGRRTR